MPASAVRFPIRRKLYVIIGIFVFNLAAVIALGVLGMWLLSSLRAYVAGEGFWSKSQKNAIYSLSKYALSRDEKDYRDYESFLKIPLGDRKARLELLKPRPELRVADAGFLEGGNHPEDVRNMAVVFLRLHRLSYIGEAIAIWTEGDAVMGELELAAQDLHRAVVSGKASKEDVRRSLREIDRINERMTALQNAFSSTLGEASRWAKRTLFRLMLGASALLGLSGLYASLLISHRIASDVRAVSEAAAKVAEGDLSPRVSVASQDELGQLAQAFNRMTEGLAKLDKLKNDFISTVSHELRTPLTLTLAPLESLLSGQMGALPGEQRSLLEVMHNNTMRLLQMVSGLLDFSKLEAGKVEARREPTDIAALTRGIVEDFRPITRSKGQALELELPLGAAAAEMDRYLYERILFNLLSNAVKFTPAGGRIAVRLEQPADAVKLSVRDTGIGVSEEDQRRLFERFRQIESSSTRRFEGTGLGLALVREFCQLLEGGAAVRSSPGQGSEFSVVLPALRTRTEPAISARAAGGLAPRFEPAWEPPSGEPPATLQKVLIVEDNVELALYLKRLLRGLCEVAIVTDGEAAYSRILEWRPDLVISDVMMPKKDGLALCRELKAGAATMFIPVILLTALTQREAMTRGWQAGADEYLFKPFHPAEVVTRVKYMLESQRARRAAERELVAAKEAAEGLNKELETFSYSVAHDLRAPLRKIAGFGRLLENRLVDRLDPQERDYLRRIQANIAHMDGLIDVLLRLARITRQELHPEPLDLSRIASDIAEELRRHEPGRRVDFAIAPGLSARADPEFMRIALRNLIENAWKFTSKLPRARIEVGKAAAGGGEAFFVRDDGAGFDMAYAGKLFGAFERLHAPGEFPGTGVGLATVSRIIRRHGGRIWAEAAVDRGATFYFTLEPAQAQERAHA